MRDTVCLCNHKGGCGKTTLSLLVLEAVAYLRNERPGLLPPSWLKGSLLAVDCDPQGNLTEALGCNPASAKVTLADFLREPENTTRIAENGGVVEARVRGLEDVYCIPSNMKLEPVSDLLRLPSTGRDQLKRVLKSLPGEFSLCVLDTPPNLGQFTRAALLASDAFITPATLSKHAVGGIVNVLQFAAMLEKETKTWGIEFLGAVISHYDRRIRLQKELFACVEEKISALFRCVIPVSSRLVENMAMQRHMFSEMSRREILRFLPLPCEIAERLAPQKGEEHLSYYGKEPAK